MLKQLKLRAELKEKRSKLDALTKKKEEYSKRRDELSAALEEAQTEEDIKVVTDSIEELEKEIGDENVEEEVKNLEERIEQIENELQETEERSKEAVKQPEHKRSKKYGGAVMSQRTKFFGLNIEQRDALIASDEVQNFLKRTREMSIQKRSVTGADIMVPETLLDLIKENIDKYSKLIKFVRLKPVKGTARQPIMGTIPEGIWTEMTGALNELDFKFNQAEVDGYKVGGYVAIPNSSMDDDVNLLTELIAGIGQAIGYALDKAIVYGAGTKQPLGIVTRLAQTSQPDGYSDKCRAWEDLHTSNIKKINETTAQSLWEKIVLYSGAAKSKYSIGSEVKFCAMNETTYKILLSKLISFNVAGMQVAQMSNQMPIIGGEIVELDFMADGDVLYGYGDLYL
ncbi:MAG: phage major capsid protein, partial [Acetivibrio ethanolgignens]